MLISFLSGRRPLTSPKIVKHHMIEVSATENDPTKTQTGDEIFIR
jgi:hypothetical protein